MNTSIDQKIAYEFMFNGTHKDGEYHNFKSRTIYAYDIGDAERQLKKDYVTINIFFKGVV